MINRLKSMLLPAGLTTRMTKQKTQRVENFLVGENVAMQSAVAAPKIFVSELRRQSSVPGQERATIVAKLQERASVDVVRMQHIQNSVTLLR